jgi:hypothetical protein
MHASGGFAFWQWIIVGRRRVILDVELNRSAEEFLG